MANKWKAGNYMNSGLSKSQYLAKQSSPKKSSSKTTTAKKTSSSSSSTYTGPYAPGYTGPKQAEYSTPVKSSYYSGPYAPDYTGPRQSGYDQPVKSSSSKSSSSKSKSSSVNTSQRNTASSLFNSVLGVPTAEASSGSTRKPSQIKGTSSLGNIVGYLGQAALGVPGSIYKGVTGRNIDLGLTEALGLSKNIDNPLQGGDVQTDWQTVLNPAPDKPTGYGQNGETYYNNYNPQTDGGSVFQSDFAKPGTNFSRPGSETAYNQGTSPISYGNSQRNAQQTSGISQSYSPARTSSNQRTPNLVSNPNGSSNISSAYQPEQSSADLSSLLQDYTPSQPNNGTVRQFLGNGYLSGGMASNGKGDYGIQGTIGGSDQGNIMDDLLTVLGIKPMTASAYTMPQTNAFGMPTQNAFTQPSYDYVNSGDYNKWMSQLYPNGQDNESNLPQRASDTSQNMNGGGVAQQYSQPTYNPVSQQVNSMLGGYDQQYKQQQKSFSQQEKAQKKALDELLKQINKQYNTDKETGQTDLNRAKQEDLQRLSSQFDFANSSPNDEQRIQYQGRLTNDYAGKLNDLLNKLSQSRSSQVSSAKQNYQSSLSDLSSQNQNILNELLGRKSNLQLDLAKMEQDAQQKALDRSSKGSYAKQKNASLTKLGVDSNGQPIYWDNVNNTLFNGVPSGTRNAVDPVTSYLQQLAGNQGGGQGGTWETLPDGSRVFVTDYD